MASEADQSTNSSDNTQEEQKTNEENWFTRPYRRGLLSDIYHAVFSFKAGLICLLLLAAYLYKQELNELYKENIVCTVLDRFNSVTTHDWIAALTWGVVLVYCAVKILHCHRFHILTTFTVLLVCGIYLFFRYHYDEVYQFYRFTTIEILAYLDFAWPLLITFLGLFLFNDGPYFFRKYFIPEPPVNKEGFLTDTPLNLKNEDEQDYFGWVPKSNQLVDLINVSTVPHSFAIGISSEWGSGKTSFFNLVKHKLEEKKYDRYIIVDFRPWFSKDSNKIIEDFFSAFQSATEKYDSKLSSDLVAYSNRLKSLTSNQLTNLIHNGVEMFYPNSDITAKYEEINGLIKRLNRKIIVFIDDLDRLDKKEIVEVLRIIRNTSNFYNTFFLLAYDRDYVNGAVKDINEHKSEKYLDKIVQFEMSLPYYDQKLLSDIFLEKLHQIIYPGEQIHFTAFKSLPINSTTFNTRQDQSSPYSYFDVKDVLVNAREINRFLNQFMYDYATVRKAVNFNDFLQLSLIKFCFNPVWSILANKELRKSIIKETQGVVSLKDKAEIEELLVKLIPNVSYNLEQIEEHYKQKEEKEKNKDTTNQSFDTSDLEFEFDTEGLITGSNRDVYKRVNTLFLLLSNIFSKDLNKEFNRIRYESNYPFYFYQGKTLDSDYPLYRFNSDINNVSVSEEQFVNNFIQSTEKTDVYQVLELFNQLGSSYQSEESFRKAVLANVKLIFDFTKWPQKDVLEIIDRIYNAEGNGINEEVKKQLFLNIIDFYIKDLEGSIFIAYFIQQLLLKYSRLEITINQETNQVFILTKKELQEQALNILLLNIEKHNTDQPFSGEYSFYSLLYSNIERIDKKTSRIILTDRGLEVFRSLAISCPEDYFKTLIRPKYTPNIDDTYVFEPYVLQLFEGYKSKQTHYGFEEFLRENCTRPSSSVAYYRVLKMYAVILALNNNTPNQESDFSVYIPDYENWKNMPQSIPMNENLEKRYAEKIRIVMDRICSTFK
jgi:hypothetical protein